MASSGFWAEGCYVDKDCAYDGDGSAHWVRFAYEAPDSNRHEGTCPLYRNEWECADPGWRTVIVGDARRPERIEFPHKMVFLPRDC